MDVSLKGLASLDRFHLVLGSCLLLSASLFPVSAAPGPFTYCSIIETSDSIRDSVECSARQSKGDVLLDTPEVARCSGNVLDVLGIFIAQW